MRVAIFQKEKHLRNLPELFVVLKVATRWLHKSLFCSFVHSSSHMNVNVVDENRKRAARRCWCKVKIKCENQFFTETSWSDCTRFPLFLMIAQLFLRIVSNSDIKLKLSSHSVGDCARNINLHHQNSDHCLRKKIWPRSVPELDTRNMCLGRNWRNNLLLKFMVERSHNSRAA